MKRTKKITQVGFILKGNVTLNFWGGGEGTIVMKDLKLTYETMTPKNILRCVNDNGFGCENIASAEIDIYIWYNNGSTEYERTIFVDHPIHIQYFNQWRELPSFLIPLRLINKQTK